MKLSEVIDKYRALFDDGRLPYTKCNNCSHVFYYARSSCPKCQSADLDIRASSGHGTIYSVTGLLDKNKRETYYSIIEMDEGFRLYSTVISESAPEIGDSVSVTVINVNGKNYPFFKKT